MTKQYLLAGLPDRKPDPLLALIKKFASNERLDKIDLGVGVYRDGTGRTPVMAAVKSAEHHLWETQDTKSYIGPEGDPSFVSLLTHEVFGEGTVTEKLAGVQTPGGTAALRLSAEILAHDKDRTIWIGTPTWANHNAIFGTVGLGIKTYRFFDPRSQAVHVDEMLSAFESAQSGDAILLHASCHNPTGAAISKEAWSAIAEVVARKGLIPVFDNAYQGLGRGFVQDAEGMLTVLNAADEAIVAISCSKSFSLYRERTGAAFVLGNSATDLNKGVANFAYHARASYSMPPAHGAAIVAAVLGDPGRRKLWIDELASMRSRVSEIRTALADRLSIYAPRLSAVAGQEGMFSLLPVTPENVTHLREVHGIYMPDSGRVNLAGLRIEQVDLASQAIGELL
ncbi:MULTISPECIES: aromatic amino acid transaminase [unclassified Sinorhizobium]|uniref:aromatic amino acid transaminase n=1 Tax=unclassified Sinorhizobium TaxID=2613772 RepID=UPI00352404F2